MLAVAHHVKVFASHLDAFARVGRGIALAQALPGCGGAKGVEHMQAGPGARFTPARANRAAPVGVLLQRARGAGGPGLRLALLAACSAASRPGGNADCIASMSWSSSACGSAGELSLSSSA